VILSIIILRKFQK